MTGGVLALISTSYIAGMQFVRQGIPLLPSFQALTAQYRLRVNTKRKSIAEIDSAKHRVIGSLN